MPGNCRPRSHHPIENAFTRIELVIILLVIVALLGLVTPTIRKFRRVSAVVACPVAYVDQYHTVWICDAFGKQRIKVSHIPAESAHVRWSPKGDWIAFDGEGGIVAVHVITGEHRIIKDVRCPTWIDNQTVVVIHRIEGRHELWKASIEQGQAGRWRELLGPDEVGGFVESDYEPEHAGGFVVCESESISVRKMDVVQRSQNWQKVKTIWSDASNDIEDLGPQIDPTGMWVAWSRAKAAGTGANLNYAVALKRLDASPSTPPTMFGGDFSNACLCDWTPDGQLLVGVERQDGTRKLMVLDRTSGKPLKELESPYGLAALSYTAADWRHLRNW